MTGSFDADTLLSRLRTLCKGRPVSEAQLSAFVSALKASDEIDALALAFLKGLDEIAWMRFVLQHDFDSVATFIKEVERLRQKSPAQ